MESIESLNMALELYQGTLIFVSHDREFVSSTATRILEITPERVIDFSGNYEDYLRSKGSSKLLSVALIWSGLLKLMTNAKIAVRYAYQAAVYRNILNFHDFVCQIRRLRRIRHNDMHFLNKLNWR